MRPISGRGEFEVQSQGLVAFLALWDEFESVSFWVVRFGRAGVARSIRMIEVPRLRAIR